MSERRALNVIDHVEGTPIYTQSSHIGNVSPPFFGALIQNLKNEKKTHKQYAKL